MGREVRMVPPDWQHPKDERGRHVPLLDGSAADAIAAWDEERAQWDRGFVRSWKKDGEEWLGRAEISCTRFTEWKGHRPDPEDYMPDFAPGTATHFMMYETCSEGTPISPAFATPDELARWLADNAASAFGSMTASYDQWLATCRNGWAPSAVIADGAVEPGVAIWSQEPEEVK
jgi:hypothetical protein